MLVPVGGASLPGVAPAGQSEREDNVKGFVPRPGLAAAAVAASVLLALVSAAEGPDAKPEIRRLGKTVSQYRDGLIRVVVSTRYANTHLDRSWIPIEVCLSAESGKPVAISREDVSLVAENGAVMPLPTQKAMSIEVPDVRHVLDTARLTREPLTGYFPWADFEERLRFFTVPGEGTVLEEEVATHSRVLIGYLFFRSPTGSWPAGSYQLAIRNPDLNVRLPFRLPAADFPEKEGDPKVVPW
jgi:hypothetical protein